MPAEFFERFSRARPRDRCSSASTSYTTRPLCPDSMANSAIVSDGGESLDVPSLSNFEIKRPRRAGCCRVVLIVLLLLILLIGLILGLFFGLDAFWRQRKPEVMTVCGLIRGERIDGIFRFLGIPYALPPTGSRRFRSPSDIYTRSVCPGEWPRDAKSYGPACLQAKPLGNGVIGSEDCLFLNVFSLDNSPRSSPRPVIVALGGLFFLYGSADQRGFKVTPELVKATGAVHVTLNYRLGALGFLAAKGTSNLGLWDQVSALRWVKNNIRQFGGDPNNVMLFGFGSGATSAMTLAMAAPVATTDLFHKVWLSGPMLQVDRSADDAMREHKKNFGCKTNSCFANKTGSELAKLLKITPSLRNFWFEVPYGLRKRKGPGFVVLDNVLLKEAPFSTSYLRLADVPFVLGSTSNEVDVYLSPRGMRQLTHSDYFVHYLNSTLRPSAASLAELRRLYPKDSGTVEDIHTRAVTDLRVGCPLTCFAEFLLSKKVPRLYRYVVHGSSRHVDPYGFQLMVNSSFRGWDALLYFSDGGLDSVAFGDPMTETSLRDRLRAAVAAFARDGTVPAFETVPAVNVMNLKRTVALTDYRKDQCAFWRREGSNDCFAFAWAT